MSEYSISNKDLTIFLVVTFGLTIGMGIVMGFAYTKYPVDSFGVIQMYYPAIGVMMALLLNKERRKKLPMKFYGAYLFFTITSVLFLLAEVFVFHKDPGMYIECWMILGSITSFLLCSSSDEKEKMNSLGLGFGKNVKASIGYIVLFITLNLCVNFLAAIIFDGGKEFITTLRNGKIMRILFLAPLLFSLEFIMFLGEEYGWRYFLQTALQQRLGKRKGIVLLGIIWGIWHLPLNLFYYSPMTPFYSILNQLIVCISYAIFLGFVYMKTENIWTVSIIHYLNNNFAFILYNNSGANVVLSGKLVLVNLICMSVVYLPFLFTKEYRKYKKEIELTNEL
ncbi:CPBP family intramembrane glutamic endopeptidase [Clostridium peptidivorans]|uniref:CPBP family intramembrane glutamic endopeptidase n=1 Tax=Clostridium peptidivorans TaxID=100174 RepID=UPI000BE38791|nr:CPBP family intramembrane glutamic endopeptidase [Clostridium peptidivorans]